MTHRRGMPQTNSTKGGCPIPTKVVVVKNLKNWSCTKNKVLDGDALKELKEGCWSKQTLGKGMN